MSVTAKFKVQSTVPQDYGDGTSGAQLTLVPDYANGRNKEWSKWTPAGCINMNVKNPVAEQFTIGRAFTVTFEPED